MLDREREFEKFRIAIESVCHLQPGAWDDLSELLTLKQYKKNDYLSREGEMAYNAVFLLDGIVRVFYRSKDGAEYNKTFFVPGMFPTPLTALLSGTPNLINFQALTDCDTVELNFAEFKKLFKKYPSLDSFMRIVLEIEWIKKERHDIRMVTNSAAENYEIFLEEHPGLEQQIPQYHIASYLGITPIQLSRIRSSKQ